MHMNIQKAPASGSITISYNFLGVALIILLAIMGVIIVVDRTTGIGIALAEYIAIATFGCVTIALVYNAIALQYNYQLNKIKLEKAAMQERKEIIKFTYQVTSTWWQLDMSSNAERAKRFIKPYKGQLHHPDQLLQFKRKMDSKEGYEDRRSLIAILNYFENLSLLVSDGMIDEEILQKCFKTLFLTYYHQLKEYITDVQSAHNEGSSKIYLNFVCLCKRWELN